jgi:hypothetical protein
MGYEWSEYMHPRLNIHNSFTRSYPLEKENRTLNRSKNCNWNEPLGIHPSEK